MGSGKVHRMKKLIRWNASETIKNEKVYLRKVRKSFPFKQSKRSDAGVSLS